MLPNSSDLNYFVAVAETQNISRAAERLGISQPSLSVSIKRLEDNIGTSLLIRSKTGVKLTETGHRLAQQAQKLLDDWESIRNEALKHQSEVRGRYTIGCHPSVASYTLGDFLPGFLNEHQGVEVSIKHDLSRHITEDIVSFKVDVGLVINPVKHPDLVIRPLLKDEVTIWTHSNASSIQTSGNPGSTLICDPNLIQTQDLLKRLARKKVVYDRILYSTNLEVIRSLVENKAGAGILPTRVARRSSQKLKTLGADAPIFKDQLALVYRMDMPRTAGFRELVKVIEKKIKQ